jgi:hypothetical protein
MRRTSLKDTKVLRKGEVERRMLRLAGMEARDDAEDRDLDDPEEDGADCAEEGVLGECTDQSDLGVPPSHESGTLASGLPQKLGCNVPGGREASSCLRHTVHVLVMRT